MDATKIGPVEVWLSQSNIAVTCMIVHEDESTTTLDVDSLSMRGAQREITGYLLEEGRKPVGRWEETASGDDGSVESMRKFHPVAAPKS